MLNFVVELHPLLGVTLSMLVSVVLGLSVYFVSHKLISKYQEGDSGPPASLFGVVGMLVGLMLWLSFAKVISDIRSIDSAIVREAAAILDVSDDLGRYDHDDSREIQMLLVQYTESVINDDWPALADDRLGKKTTALKIEILDRLAMLKPTTPIQERLISQIEDDVDAISDHRLVRLNSTLSEPPTYVYVTFLGFLLTMACFGAYPPQVPLVTLVGLYAAFVGLVLFLIMTLSDPFQGVGIAPTTFEHILETMKEDH